VRQRKSRAKKGFLRANQEIHSLALLSVVPARLEQFKLAVENRALATDYKSMTRVLAGRSSAR
jgi:hypothetical protein